MRIRILIPDEPNIRYSKQDLLALPELKPFRHYESEGLGSVSQRTKEETKLPPAVETLKDLQSVYNLADLYPPGLSKIIKDITEVLMLDTQGRIIIDVNRNTKTPDDNENPKPGPEQVTPPQPENPVGPTPPITPTPVEPVPPTEYEPPEEKPPTITVQSKTGPVSFEPLVDVFSKKPVFKLQLDPKKSLVQLSREADASDDNAIKKYYTSKMIQISMRFFTVMCTLSDEAHMPDYSYLMMPFDGTAVSTTDPNQRHLIDKICKNQVTYDQRERQMNKTHTAKNMLIMTRGRASAEAQRERYFEEQYKKQQPTYSSTFSNDLLEASRAEANEKYQQSSYNMFKFLDSATKITNSLLNTTIDSATAKSQLSQTGSDIFAQTPPPAATPDHIDDNFDETNKMNDKAKKMIADQKKNAVAGGSGGGGPVGSHPTKLGTGTVDTGGCNDSVLELSFKVANEVSKRTGLPADWIWGQMAHETGGFNSELAALGNWAGIKGGGDTDSRGHTQYGGSGSEEFISIYSSTLNNEPGMSSAKTIDDFAVCCKNGGYYSADLSEYTSALHRWVPNPTTL